MLLVNLESEAYFAFDSLEDAIPEVEQSHTSLEAQQEVCVCIAACVSDALHLRGQLT